MRSLKKIVSSSYNHEGSLKHFLFADEKAQQLGEMENNTSQALLSVYFSDSNGLSLVGKDASSMRCESHTYYEYKDLHLNC